MLEIITLRDRSASFRADCESADKGRDDQGVDDADKEAANQPHDDKSTVCGAMLLAHGCHIGYCRRRRTERDTAETGRDDDRFVVPSHKPEDDEDRERDCEGYLHGKGGSDECEYPIQLSKLQSHQCHRQEEAEREIRHKGKPFVHAGPRSLYACTYGNRHEITDEDSGQKATHERWKVETGERYQATDAEVEDQRKIQRKDRPQDAQIVESGLPAIVGGADIKFRVMGASDNVTFHQEGGDWAADDARRDQADGIAGNAEFHRI